jgi:DNA replication protein DnaC
VSQVILARGGEQKKFGSRLRRAQFRTTKTLEQFDFERLPQLNRTLVHDLATVRQGIDVVFTTCANLTQSLNAARATGTYERRLAALARVPLLIIDDFALKPLRTSADEDLHDLIAGRYELDRQRHNAYCLVLDGQSYRSPKLAPATPKSAP